MEFEQNLVTLLYLFSLFGLSVDNGDRETESLGVGSRSSSGQGILSHDHSVSVVGDLKRRFTLKGTLTLTRKQITFGKKLK